MTHYPQPRRWRGVTLTNTWIDETQHLTDTDWRRLTHRLTRAVRRTPWHRATHLKTRYHQRRR
ncbi:hypothetical protein [Nonomuraea sp. NPDC005650]|uniref:hypothetical protein n=1 Tax=Nonomuraea sp. NPDC005650 TaxID=3157045 RepID=UPI0033B17DD0